MNLFVLKEKLSEIISKINSNLSEDEKMQFINNEVGSYLTTLLEDETIDYYKMICDSSNQQADDYVYADLSVRLSKSTNYHYIQLKTIR